MTLLTQIKQAQLQARKSRSTTAVSSLTTLIGDVEMIGKNAGREVTDSETMATVKKFIKNIDETLRVVTDSAVIMNLQAEKALYEQFLPKQLTEDELRAAVALIISEVGATGPKDMGKVMKPLKERFDGQFDGTLASTVVKAALAA